MALPHCSNFFGNVSVTVDVPTVKSYDECVFRPMSKKVFLDRDEAWGLYSADGSIIKEAAYRRGESKALVGQSEFYSNDERVEESRESCVYFGPIIPHYGHFLVTSLSRLWFVVDEVAKGRKLLCHGDHAPQDYFNIPYMGQLLRAAGLAVSDFVSPTVVTRFRDVLVPSPAFVEQSHASFSYVPKMHSIGDALLWERDAAQLKKVAYLSKSRLQPPAVAKMTNEYIVDEIMRDAGVDVIYPENLTLLEQVEMFASYSSILGFAGSAFHTHIFVQKPPEIICATYDPFINSNFLMLDALNQAEAQYRYPHGNIVPAEIAGFAVSRSLVDPMKFANEILDVAGISKRNVFASCSSSMESEMFHANCIADLKGESYRSTLVRLHRALKPKAYLEIGTLTGGTLALSSSPSIAIDPRFQVSDEVIGNKPLCLFYQMPSDDFFEQYDPKLLLGHSLDLTFLDGMHRCEYLLRDFINAERHASIDGVIALHDCLPVEIPMTDRTQNGTPPVMPHRGGWWTGDVWRTVLLIKKRRPDLNIISLDAAPTGLILISGLDPYSTILKNNYSECVSEMFEMDLERISIQGFMDEMNVTSTALVADEAALLGMLRRT